MAKGVEASVKPELLVWARSSAGFTVEQAAEKLHVRPERLIEWEKGQKRPTVNQLRTVAHLYKRPLAVFYLREPPVDFDPLRDYRSLSAQIPKAESPQLRLEIRRAWSRREIALELYEALEGHPPEFLLDTRRRETSEALAKRVRSSVKVTRETQSSFSNDYEALNWWRHGLEELGILVFQASGVDLAEMRGFSIGKRPFPVIVINAKDSPVARIFTMLHELVHIVRREGALCDLEESIPLSDAQGLEVFCNRVAGEILIPSEDLAREEIVQRRGFSEGWSDDEISGIARTYRVSNEVALRRLVICGLASDDFYRLKRAEWQLRRPSPRSGGPPRHKRALSAVGGTFARLVLVNYYQERITARDVSDFLNLKVKHLRLFEQEVMGHNVEFGAVA